MIYKYFFYYTVKIGNSISHCNIILDLPKELNNPTTLKAVEKFLNDNTQNAELVCICNWKFIGKEIDKNTSVSVKKSDIDG